MKKLCKYLEKSRKKAGLSQDDVGRLLGFSNGQFISNIEREECDLPPKHFKKICKLYKLDPEHMINLAICDYVDSLRKVMGV